MHTPTLVIASQGTLHCYDGRGVRDLYLLLTTQPELLADSTVIDIVVGRGAAALFVLGGIRRLHALTLSRPALDMLTSHDIDVTYDTLVEGIRNRAGTGPCPVEAACADVADPRECLERIRTFLLSIGAISQ